MVLYLIGLGLGNAEDVTLKGLNIIKKCDKIYLEYYTSILGVSKETLEETYGVTIEIRRREDIENDKEADKMLDEAEKGSVALLIVGDPLAATTHSDIITRTRQRNISVEVIHNASVFTAVAQSGLQLYKFGYTVSIPFFTSKWRPDSFFDRIVKNIEYDMHTLVLLDIRIRERTEENIIKGLEIYEPPSFMTISTAVSQILEVQKKREKNNEKKILDHSTLAIAFARLGQSNQKIVYATLKELLTIDMGPPLHSLVIPASLHFAEIDLLNFFRYHSE